MYLAARNEHLQKKLFSFKKKKDCNCDRFGLNYRLSGLWEKVKRSFVNSIHKHILYGVKPNIVFLLKVNIKNLLNVLTSKKNRYDKFSKGFTLKHKCIHKLQKNKSKYKILNSSLDTVDLENQILNCFKKLEK